MPRLVLLATSGAGVHHIRREKRRARRQWRELTHADLLFFLENVRFPLIAKFALKTEIAEIKRPIEGSKIAEKFAKFPPHRPKC